MTTWCVADVVGAARKLWPESSAESWDRVGLLAGEPAHPVNKVLFAVDPTLAVIAEAAAQSCELIITHHPLLLRGIHTAAADTLKGALLTKLIRNEIALYSAHTNADQPAGGVSAALAAAFGLRNCQAIVPAPDPLPGRSDTAFGLGRVGDLEAPLTLAQFAESVAAVLPPTAGGVRVAGDAARKVQRVALLGGAGDSLLEHPVVLSADVYVTSDLRHHPALDARERACLGIGPAVIDVAHAAAESLWLTAASATLADMLPGLKCAVSGINTDPWDFHLS